MEVVYYSPHIKLLNLKTFFGRDCKIAIEKENKLLITTLNPSDMKGALILIKNNGIFYKNIKN